MAGEGGAHTEGFAHETSNGGHAPRVLVVSNGHGEDTIGAELVKSVRAEAGELPLALLAWPMVGAGSAYVRAHVQIRGPSNMLPSEGFGTLSARAFVRDVRAGWFGVHWAQWHAARALRGTLDFVVAIGDVVPLLVARTSTAPFVFVGCAKSAYFDGASGYTAFERWLMRAAYAVYPRDSRTSDALRAHAIRVSDVGNPMMDTMGSSGVRSTIPWRRNERVVACLPGSRADREHNAARILTMLADREEELAQARLTHVVLAVAEGFDVATLRTLLARAPTRWTWTSEYVTQESPHTARAGALHATIVFDAMHEIFAHADVAIGLAGTANEQAIGSGVPVVTFATDGAQGESYLRMKMPYFGASVMQVPGESRALSDALLRIVGDESLRASMIAAGRERMGTPGATAAIARDIVDVLRRG